MTCIETKHSPCFYRKGCIWGAGWPKIEVRSVSFFVGFEVLVRRSHLRLLGSVESKQNGSVWHLESKLASNEVASRLKGSSSQDKACNMGTHKSPRTFIILIYLDWMVVKDG